jgi:membrane-associated protease RseP (regulator of RpoE activity)
MQLAALVFFSVMLSWIFSSAQAGLAWLLGAKPQKLVLSRGPTLAKTGWRGVELELRLLPLGSIVSFGEDPCDNAFAKLHPAKRALVIATGPCALVFVALLVFGDAGTTWARFEKGLGQVFMGALQPLATGGPLIKKMLALTAASPLEALGILSVKMAAANALPLPGLAGNEALVTLFHWKRPPQKTSESVLMAGVLIWIALAAGWSFALFYALG